MSTLPKVQVTRVSKEFVSVKREKVLGFEAGGLAAVTFLLRQVMTSEGGKAGGKKPKRKSRTVVALDDVSFDVPPGQVLGIIGRNGAGKSTLLKVLARVLEPTAGRVVIRGRAVSMLELGIGFAPDLTVRENIQICGRLAGASAAQIRAAEGQILEFSHLGKFRDTPLMRCPSGSAVQLAFSAMLSFQADIVLADEVLAVGDSQFRRACEQRIRSVGQSGEAVLFVSHDMNAIRRTCSRVVWLDKGRVRQIGAPEDIINAYTTELMAGRLIAPTQRDLAAGCRILDLRLLDAEGAQVGAVQITEPVSVDCVIRVEHPDILVVVQFELWRGKVHVLTSTNPTPIRVENPKTFRASAGLPADFLNDVTYQVRARLLVQHHNHPSDQPIVASEQVLDVTVMNPRPESSVWSDWPWGRHGLISPRLEWRMTPEGSGSSSRQGAGRASEEGIATSE